MDKSFADEPRVILIGRTNVGKSTFFRAVTNKQALISPTPHTTRDAKEAQVEWRNKVFTLVDTGGFDIERDNPFGSAITQTIVRELERADLALVVTDQREQIRPEEAKLIRDIRRAKKSMIIILNKVDKPADRRNLAHLQIKGVHTIPVSSTNGGGIGDALDAIVAQLQTSGTLRQPHFTLGLVGRTNVGKSALFNALIKEERAIVSPEHHTTRESQSAFINTNGFTIEIIDTAGPRRRASKDIEKKMQQMTKKTLAESDVVAVLTEAGATPVPAQDLEFVGEAARLRKSIVIVNAKWDLISQSIGAERKETTRLARAFGQYTYVPVCMVSAQKKLRLKQFIETACNVFTEQDVELSPEQLLAAKQYCYPLISALHQIGKRPPRFESVSYEKSVPEAAATIVAKAIRRQHPYSGTPIVISVAKRSRHAPTHRPG